MQSSTNPKPFNHLQWLSLAQHNCMAWRCKFMNTNSSTIRFSFSRSSCTRWYVLSLHACVSYDPPPNFVQLLLTLIPESLSQVDNCCHTPLHVAVGTRASLSVIQLLAETYPAACDIQDKDGKTPLHLACDSSCKLFNVDWEVTNPPSINLVWTLIMISPTSVAMEDRFNTSALEYAILSDAPITVVRLLQKATLMYHKSQRELQRCM